MSALTLMPVTIVCLDLAVRKRKPLFYLLAAVAMASVVLTNWLGGAVLATAVLAYLLSTGFQRPAGVWVTVLGIALLSYVLASPWIPPSTLNTIRVNAQTIGGPYQMTWWNALYGVMLGAVAFVLYWILHRVKAPQYLHMSLYFLLFVGSITLSAEWADIYLLPQPHRYHLAMDMAICLNVAFLLKLLADRIPRWGRTVAMLVVLALSVGQAMRYHLFADDWIQSLDIRTTTEYKTARWFDGHMGGKRVMAPGSTSYYMNIFTDTPQLGGGFEQGDPNWVNRVALYIIYSGENAGPRDGEMSILWLKAFGVRAVAVGGPKSGEHYKPFRNPQKFAGLLPELWRDGDDYIYSVPCRSDSLAHVVRKSDLVDRAPRHGLDADGVRRYVAALEDPMLPQAEMHWINRHRARILATVAKGQVISAQVNYHAGWRAEADGTAAEVHAAKLGLIVIEPKCEGRCVVDLIYEGGIEMKVAQLFSLSSFLGCLIWTMIATRRRSLPP